MALRDSPTLEGNRLGYVAEGTIVSITERATKKIEGYYWDKVSTPMGKGYMARENAEGTKTWLVLVENNATTNETTNNKYLEPDEDGVIFCEPNATAEQILEDEKYVEMKVVGKDGEEKTGNLLLATGDTIVLGKETLYTVVKLGDVNGDGKIKASDYVKVKNHIMKTTTLTGPNLSAADVNKDTKIKASDYVKIKNHIMKVSNISL